METLVFIGLPLLLGATVLLPGISISVYHAVQHIYGYANDGMFGYALEEEYEMGKLPLLLQIVSSTSLLVFCLYLLVLADIGSNNVGSHAALFATVVSGGLIGIGIVWTMFRLIQSVRYTLTTSSFQNLRQDDRIPAAVVERLQPLAGKACSRAKLLRAVREQIGRKQMLAYGSY